MEGNLKRLASEGKVTPEAMQVILLDEISGRLQDVDSRLEKIEGLVRFKTLNLPHIRNFPKPYQTINVPKGKRVRVWYYKVPNHMIAIIERVANDYLANFDVEWLIDGQHPEEPIIQRQLATFNDPMRLEPVKIAHDKIEWYMHNKSSSDEQMAVLIDGRLIHKKELLAIME